MNIYQKHVDLCYDTDLEWGCYLKTIPIIELFNLDVYYNKMFDDNKDVNIKNVSYKELKTRVSEIDLEDKLIIILEYPELFTPSA